MIIIKYVCIPRTITIPSVEFKCHPILPTSLHASGKCINNIDEFLAGLNLWFNFCEDKFNCNWVRSAWGYVMYGMVWLYICDCMYAHTCINWWVWYAYGKLFLTRDMSCQPIHVLWLKLDCWSELFLFDVIWNMLHHYRISHHETTTHQQPFRRLHMARNSGICVGYGDIVVLQFNHPLKYQFMQTN